MGRIFSQRPIFLPTWPGFSSQELATALELARFTYEKCEGGGHGDGEYDEEDGEAAPGATRGRQLLTQAAQSSPSPSSALLQLTSAPATTITISYVNLLPSPSGRILGSLQLEKNHCCGSGLDGPVCFLASWIRIRIH
jgi:hypothetical protein